MICYCFLGDGTSLQFDCGKLLLSLMVAEFDRVGPFAVGCGAPLLVDCRMTVVAI